jgi:hypothetical protein
MTTPSGQIGFDQINTELALTPTAQISMNDAAVRALAGVPTPGSQISMTNLQGKSNLWTGTISTPQANLNLYTWATTVASPAYPGSGAVQVTVAPGVYVWSSATPVAALTVPSSFTSPVSIINNGYIMGMGGAGGDVPNSTCWVPGFNGGPALAISKPVTITNNSYIAGGGGGGGASPFSGGGGGAGGGSTAARQVSPTGNGAIVLGGSIGTSGIMGGYYSRNLPTSKISYGSAGSGGRILPGTGGAGGIGSLGTPVQGGGGGAGGGGGGAINVNPSVNPSSNGGAGGSAGGAGGTGSNPNGSGVQGGGGGGGWGAAGGPTTSGPTPVRTGGNGGNAISLNANSVTWGATGTVYGSVA